MKRQRSVHSANMQGRVKSNRTVMSRQEGKGREEKRIKTKDSKHEYESKGVPLEL